MQPLWGGGSEDSPDDRDYDRDLDDTGTHAADEPTAMWDENALRELGLDTPPEQAEKGPATQGTGRHRAVGVELAADNARIWAITLVLSLGLGAGMFYLARFSSMLPCPAGGRCPCHAKGVALALHS